MSPASAAHGSRPRRRLGVDAIVKAGPVLSVPASSTQALEDVSTRCSAGPSVHASLIRGGDELSSYPAAASSSLERRTLPGETAAEVERELAGVLDRCRAADPEL